MKLDARLAHFAAFPRILESVVAGWPTEDSLRWRPRDGAWSVVEICAHLLDEEREDFRPRILSTLKDPAHPWPSIDPEAWVQQRGYQDRKVPELLAEFAKERAASLALLRELPEPTQPDWDRCYRHPSLGPLRAGDLLAAWLAHDTLHLRQLSRLQFDHCGAESERYQAGYAGPPRDWLSPG